MDLCFTEDFVMVQRNSFWVALFKKHFLEAAEDTVRDDMLFYVRKTAEKATFNIPKVSLVVYSCYLTKICFTSVKLSSGSAT